MKFLSLVSVVCVVFVHFVSPMPVYMGTPEVKQRRDASQSIVCAVRKLQAAVEHVELEREVPCVTLAHENVQDLLSKLEILRAYATREQIFDSLSSPETVNTLLQVMNSTLPLIIAHVVETELESSIGIQGSGDSGYDSVSCFSDFCRNNCAVCTANCGIHRLRRGILNLVVMLEDYFPESHKCTVCVEENILSEAEELANRLEGITDEMLAPTPNNYQCIRIVLSQPLSRCDHVLEVQSWLETISSWMNGNLTSPNDSQSLTGLPVVIEQLTTAVLPEIRRSLIILEDGNCIDLGCDSELPSPSQVTQQVNSALINSDCTLEPQLLVKLRILDLLRINYSRFVRELLPLYLPS